MEERKQARAGDTLQEIHKRYVENHARERNRSWKQGDSLMKTYVLPKLGQRKIKDIERSDMRRIFSDLSEHKVLANQVLGAASAVFSWALDEEELIDQNPCSGIKRHKTQPSTRFLSNDEIRAVWPLLDNLCQHQGTILKLVLLTGQRPGEVTSMRWEHLDLDAGWWRLPGAPTAGWPGTKNKADHEAPLTEPAVELLALLGPEPSGHVFPSTRAGKCVGIPVTKDVWAEADIPRFRPHDLRATCATKMDELGVIQQYVSLVLNHKIDKGESRTTASYIRHQKRQHKLSALGAWGIELLAILQGKGKTDHKADVLPLRKRLAG